MHGFLYYVENLLNEVLASTHELVELYCVTQGECATPLMFHIITAKTRLLLLLSAGLTHCGRRKPAANGAFNVPIPEAELIVSACKPH